MTAFLTRPKTRAKSASGQLEPKAMTGPKDSLAPIPDLPALVDASSVPVSDRF